MLSKGGLFDTLRFAPDGGALVYVQPDFSSSRRSQRAAPLVLVSRSLESDSQERILARGKHPVFTPDGGWIVYSAAVRDGFRLWRMRPDGSGRTPIGAGSRDELSPAVSPDGRFIAYIAKEGGTNSLFVRRLDGSGDRLLLRDGAADWPVW